MKAKSLTLTQLYAEQCAYLLWFKTFSGMTTEREESHMGKLLSAVNKKITDRGGVIDSNKRY